MLSRGASKALSFEGITPIDIAEQKGFDEVVRLLGGSPERINSARKKKRKAPKFCRKLFDERRVSFRQFKGIEDYWPEFHAEVRDLRVRVAQLRVISAVNDREPRAEQATYAYLLRYLELTLELHNRLYAAASTGDLKVVNSCLLQGADVYYTTPDGDTPLLVAVRNGHDEVEQALLKGRRIKKE